MLECCCVFPAPPPATPPPPRAGWRFTKAGEVLSSPVDGPEVLRTADCRRGRSERSEDNVLHEGRVVQSYKDVMQYNGYLGTSVHIHMYTNMPTVEILQ